MNNDDDSWSKPRLNEDEQQGARSHQIGAHIFRSWPSGVVGVVDEQNERFRPFVLKQISARAPPGLGANICDC
jgi:hypothetical protein